jgi:hypothetical protein
MISLSRHFLVAIVRTSASLVMLLAASTACQAQGYPGSQHGTVSQRVAFTDISVIYNRPTARGRELFGDSGVVHWGRVWNPGADSATHIVLSQDVKVNGQRLEAGEYSLWLIPAPTGPWTLIFNRKAHVFHTPYPGPDGDALRLQVAPESGAHLETLTIYFPEVLRDTAVLRIHWGEVVIPLNIEAGYRPE